MSINVLFIASEVAPFVKVGGLADVAGALPNTLIELGSDTRVIMPLYKSIKINYQKDLKLISWKMVKMGWRSLYAGLYTLTLHNVHYYFVDNEYYFFHDQVYIDYGFDIERFCFFQRAVLDFLGEGLPFSPHVLHCNDWQTAMIPLLLDVHYKQNGFHQEIKTVYTIHNLKYQGVHGAATYQDLLDLPDYILTEELALQKGAVNAMKAGIVYSNSITTVSPTYAYEIMSDYFGEGLNDVLQKYAYKVTGILNGIHQSEYNPQTDTYLSFNYNKSNWKKGKRISKAELQQRLGLDCNPRAPLCVMVSRLVDQKGLDLFLHVLEEMLFDGMQVVVLGTGTPGYQNRLMEIAAQNPEKMSTCIGFDNALAHLIYAASDIYLMPSLFEPCGLSQMIAMAYGSVPVVRETGGLKDTVFPYNEYEETGNGFAFSNINAHEFLFTTKYACDIYRHHSDSWKGIVFRGMTGDYSWKKSAQQYLGLFSFITDIPQD